MSVYPSIHPSILLEKQCLEKKGAPGFPALALAQHRHPAYHGLEALSEFPMDGEFTTSWSFRK
jgi:hypothetical protein